MQTTSSAHPVSVAEPAPPVVAARTSQAAILTACAVAIGAGLGFVFGAAAFALYLLPMPVALVLLWGSTDVRRSDES
jgi:hypothetical protein